MVNIKSFFDEDTATFTYVVSDKNTNKAAVIDSVLNYDQYSGRTKTDSADLVIEYINTSGLSLEWLLETHIHADHLTASHYLQEKLGGKIAIGSGIQEVLKFWIPVFNISNDTDIDASQFDVILRDNDVIRLGNVDIKVLHTPGHTPACVSYLIEDNIFVGDTIFMPDVGTARTDFPGGSAEKLYDSISHILSLDDDVKIFTCHDYPTGDRDVSCVSKVGQQKRENILINSSISKQEYVALRNKRDEGKAVPKLLLPAIQFNLRAGNFGKEEDNGLEYIKIPVNKI